MIGAATTPRCTREHILEWLCPKSASAQQPHTALRPDEMPNPKPFSTHSLITTSPGTQYNHSSVAFTQGKSEILTHIKSMKANNGKMLQVANAQKYTNLKSSVHSSILLHNDEPVTSVVSLLTKASKGYGTETGRFTWQQ